MRHIKLSGKNVVLTEDEGSISGELDVAVDENGRGMVRYTDTTKWHIIAGQGEATLDNPEELVSLIEAEADGRDAAGNVRPFRLGSQIKDTSKEEEGGL